MNTDKKTHELLERALPFLERLLAAMGDGAEPELVALQHEVATALRAEIPNSKISNSKEEARARRDVWQLPMTLSVSWSEEMRRIYFTDVLVQNAVRNSATFEQLVVALVERFEDLEKRYVHVVSDATSFNIKIDPVYVPKDLIEKIQAKSKPGVPA